MAARSLCVLVAFALAGSAAAPALADWVEIAERTVNEVAETDVIDLPGDRRFDRIRLCVRRNPVHFIDVDVNFRNGGHQDVGLAQRINAGDCSRAIDLEGGQRDLASIVLRYEETSRRRARAVVSVMGE